MTDFGKWSDEEKKSFFADQSAQLTAENGVPAVIIGPPKTQERSRFKVENKYDGEWSQLKDTVRATVAVETPGDVASAFQSTKAHLESKGWKIANRPDDRFGEPMASGYRDYSFNVMGPEGLMGEYQINTKTMVHAKEYGRADHPVQEFRGVPGHKMYEESQKLRELADKGRLPRKAPPGKPSQARLRLLHDSMKALYDLAWEKNPR